MEVPFRTLQMTVPAVVAVFLAPVEGESSPISSLDELPQCGSQCWYSRSHTVEPGADRAPGCPANIGLSCLWIIHFVDYLQKC